MTERDAMGKFVEQGPNHFDEEEAKEVADNTAWQAKREEILKRFNLWEEYKDK